MAQVVRFSKIQIEIVLDVNHDLDPIPHMAIMFLVHSLHLTKVTVQINKEGGGV
jgi:hypothetical protein